MSSLSIFSAIVAGIIAAITAAVSFRMLKTCPILNNPVISLCIGGLTFLGLISWPSGVVGGLLIPYAALGLALVLLLLLGFFRKCREERRNKSEWQERSSPSCDEEKEPPWVGHNTE